MSYENDNKVFYYELNSNEIFTYTLLYTIQLKPQEKYPLINKSFKESITSLILNSEKTYLIAITNNKSIYYYDLNELFINRKNTVDFRLLVDNYHYDNITGIDVCVRKPLVASCSLDRWLVIWNYDTSQIELKQNVDEDLYSLAFHPSGSYLLLSTSNSIKYISIYMNYLKTIHVLYFRSCTNCLFANGGQMFAFVHGTVVQIYSSLNFKELGSIKTQEMGKIKQLRFSKDDHYLICCSMAGIIRIWNAQTTHVISEIITKGLSYIGLSLHPNNEWLFLISTEKAIRHLQLPLSEEHNFLIKHGAESKLVKKYDTKSDENTTCIEISKSGKMFCIGTNKGSIRIYLLQNGGSFKEYRMHSSSICKLCISHTDEYLISCSEDGTIVYWLIDSRFRGESYLFNQSNEEILLDQDEYLKQISIIRQFESKLQVSKEETNFMLRVKDLKFEIKKRELETRFDSQIKDLIQEIDFLDRQEKENENEFSEKYDSVIKDYFEEFDKMRLFFESKLRNESFKNENLITKIQQIDNEIETNKGKIDQLKRTEDRDNYLDLNLNEKEKRFQKLKNMGVEIENLFQFEDDLERDLRDEILKLNLNFEKSILVWLNETEIIKINTKCFRSELDSLKLSLKEYKSNHFFKYFDAENLINRQKELLESENKLKNKLNTLENLLMAEEEYLTNLIREKEPLENVTAKLVEEIDFRKENVLNKLEKKHEQLILDLEKIKKELKHRKLENFKLQVEVKRMKYSKIK